MDYKAIMEKYWIGESTLEEEKALKSYFENGKITADLLPYKALFRYVSNEQSRGMDRKVEAMVNSSKKLKVSVLSPNYFKWVNIAASIALLLMTGILYQKNTQLTKEEKIANYWSRIELKDPIEAIKKTKAALLLVSKKLNNGTEAALHQVKKVQQVSQYIKSPD